MCNVWSIWRARGKRLDFLRHNVVLYSTWLQWTTDTAWWRKCGEGGVCATFSGLVRISSIIEPSSWQFAECAGVNEFLKLIFSTRPLYLCSALYSDIIAELSSVLLQWARGGSWTFPTIWFPFAQACFTDTSNEIVAQRGAVEWESISVLTGANQNNKMKCQVNSAYGCSVHATHHEEGLTDRCLHHPVSVHDERLFLISFGRSSVWAVSELWLQRGPGSPPQRGRGTTRLPPDSPSPDSTVG